METFKRYILFMLLSLLYRCIKYLEDTTKLIRKFWKFILIEIEISLV